jgi:hypothetical protein
MYCSLCSDMALSGLPYRMSASELIFNSSRRKVLRAVAPGGQRVGGLTAMWIVRAIIARFVKIHGDDQTAIAEA